MKKFIISILTGILAFTLSSFALTREEIEKNPILKGKMLAKRCSWCHDIKKTIVAPPFKVILERYRDVPEETLKKQFFEAIKNGSKGKWHNWLKNHVQTKLGRGDVMYMPPQKPYYTDEEIKLIINWLLTLKK
ncbi:c-type cytochrome [Persephonella sp.]